MSCCDDSQYERNPLRFFIAIIINILFYFFSPLVLYSVYYVQMAHVPPIMCVIVPLALVCESRWNIPAPTSVIN